MLRAAAGRAAAAGFWKTRRFCTVSNAAIGRLWVWGVSHIALPSWSASPPHAPQTHGRVQTQLHQGAGCPCADLDRATLHTHAARPRRQGADPLPRCWARPRACERWRRERHRQTPGDHATNLGATMLVLLCMAPLAYFPWEDPARCDPESPWLLSVQNALALISSLYYTHAPQLPHASPPTRAPHIYVSSPSPRRLLASPQVEVLVS